MIEKDFTIRGVILRVNSPGGSILASDQIYTAMSDTVGLPVAICAKMMLNNEIKLKGIHLPIHKDIYLPILKELETYGIKFLEKEVDPVLYV